MSWGTIAVAGSPASELGMRLASAAERYYDTQRLSGHVPSPELQASVVAASAAACLMAQSGAVGDGLVNVSMSGNVNPGNVAQAPDHLPNSVMINVSCGDPVL